MKWHSPEGNIPGNAHDIYPWYEFENYQFKITSRDDGNKAHANLSISEIFIRDVISNYCLKQIIANIGTGVRAAFII